MPQHEIFQTPFKVDIQYDTVPTPDAYRNRGLKPGDPLTVWHVQTTNFRTRDADQGIVSMGDGFTDSPDAEYISGGVNHKTPTAVAIGRHGPFLLWGFSAPPKDMTESGRRAFLNSVVYAAQFDRAPLLVRRTMESRDRFPWMIGFIASGHTAAGARAFPAAVAEQFGNDAAKYAAWFEENRPYIYSRQRFRHEVDEDAKALGIPNYDPRLLDVCVAALERGQDLDRAARLLKRYTGEAFATPAEWRAWLAASRADLFFSDLGGYRFFSKAGPTAAHRRAVTAAAADDPTEDRPVALSAVVRPAAATVGDTVTVAVRMKIAPGWHTYAAAGKGVPAVLTRLDDTLPAGAKASGAWQLPEARPQEDGGAHYTGDLVFLRTVILEATQPGAVEIPLTVSFQACTPERCLLPESVKLTARVEVRAKPTRGRAPQ